MILPSIVITPLIENSAPHFPRDKRWDRTSHHRGIPPSSSSGNISYQKVLIPELQNVIFFTQIISVELNLPQEKARKLREVFEVLYGHKKQILGQKYQTLYLEGCFEEKCHCSC